MTVLSRSYQTVEEVAALLADELASTDERLTVFTAAAAADQAVFCRQATRDLDAVAWRGRCADLGTDVDTDSGQEFAWPRVDGFGDEILPGGELSLPDGIDAWSVAGLPGALRRAHALQAARNALRARGFDRARQAADLAHVGVTSRSGGGAGSAVDLARANSPWANLDPDAARLMADFRPFGAEAI